MSSYKHLRDRGYFNSNCRCSVVVSVRLKNKDEDRYEVEWNPKCSIHKNDVTGIEYERRHKK
jgi:hypothetical protein